MVHKCALPLMIVCMVLAGFFGLPASGVASPAPAAPRHSLQIIPSQDSHSPAEVIHDLQFFQTDCVSKTWKSKLIFFVDPCDPRNCTWQTHVSEQMKSPVTPPPVTPLRI